MLATNDLRPRILRSIGVNGQAFADQTHHLAHQQQFLRPPLRVGGGFARGRKRLNVGGHGVGQAISQPAGVWPGLFGPCPRPRPVLAPEGQPGATFKLLLII